MTAIIFTSGCTSKNLLQLIGIETSLTTPEFQDPSSNEELRIGKNGAILASESSRAVVLIRKTDSKGSPLFVACAQATPPVSVNLSTADTNSLAGSLRANKVTPELAGTLAAASVIARRTSELNRYIGIEYLQEATAANCETALNAAAFLRRGEETETYIFRDIETEQVEIGKVEIENRETPPDDPYLTYERIYQDSQNNLESIIMNSAAILLMEAQARPKIESASAKTDMADLGAMVDVLRALSSASTDSLTAAQERLDDLLSPPDQNADAEVEHPPSSSEPSPGEDVSVERTPPE